MVERRSGLQFKTIKIYGTFGATAACAGAGTAANPYKWFNFGLAESVKRRITFDFSTCTQIMLPITAGTSNVVFPAPMYMLLEQM